MWWSNNDQRRYQKDNIKMIIKRKKLTEKTTQVMTPGSDTPPGLSHSVPTSATFTDSIDRTRSGSIDSQFSLDFDFNAGPGVADFTAYNASMHSSHSQYAPIYPEYPPYEVDVKTERQMYINDSLTRRESTISTFSTYHAPPPEAMLPSYPADGEWTEEFHGTYHESLSSSPQPLDVNFFDYSHPTTSLPVAIPLDEQDQRLLDHFISAVLPSIFPILETQPHGHSSSSLRSDIILPALQTNKSYLHCCLSISAQHLKATLPTPDPASETLIDADIMRHRYATISGLCAALEADESHTQILEATLGMIIFQCTVARLDDSLPDIPWHQHFQAAISLVQTLDLPRLVTHQTGGSGTPFTMTLTSWIDILGAPFLGRSPTFAHTYREKHLSQSSPANPTSSSLGLKELMGCEDRVLYLISEIACLEALKVDGMDDIALCHHVHSLGDQIGLTETLDGKRPEGPKIPFNSQGVLSGKQLSKNITHAFRLAARIYLCSLVPGFNPQQESCKNLVQKLASALEFIPAGAGGFDRSLVWVYLIGGSVATSGSSFRSLVDERTRAMGEDVQMGSWGRLRSVLDAVWEGQDAAPENYVCWRDVMRGKGWDFLLI
jgi:hypothetical protein